MLFLLNKVDKKKKAKQSRFRCSYMDLQNKYQILATEFSKVRGQVTVLKKAVIDEQSKTQQLQVNQ